MVVVWLVAGVRGCSGSQRVRLDFIVYLSYSAEVCHMPSDISILSSGMSCSVCLSVYRHLTNWGCCCGYFNLIRRGTIPAHPLWLLVRTPGRFKLSGFDNNILRVSTGHRIIKYQRYWRTCRKRRVFI